jgi:hypothetical protein
MCVEVYKKIGSLVIGVTRSGKAHLCPQECFCLRNGVGKDELCHSCFLLHVTGILKISHYVY